MKNKFIMLTLSVALVGALSLTSVIVTKASTPIQSKGVFEVDTDKDGQSDVIISGDEIKDANEKINTLIANYETVFQSVSNGKSQIASTLLTKGASIPDDASYEELANAILGIQQKICVGIEKVPGKVEYVYHHHTNNNGEQIVSSIVPEKGGCYTTPVYHKHIGNSTNGGGCYTVSHTGTTTVNCGGCNCNVGPYGPDTSGQVYYVGNCSGCGKTLSVYGSPGWANCDNNKTVNYVYYTLGCGKNENYIDGYTLGCNLSENEIIEAYISYSK